MRDSAVRRTRSPPAVLLIGIGRRRASGATPDGQSHVHRLSELDRAARLEQRASLGFGVCVFDARCLDEAVAAHGIGAAVVDERTVGPHRVGLADRVAAVDHGGAEAAEPGAPRVHHLLHFLRVRRGFAAVINKEIFGHLKSPWSRVTRALLGYHFSTGRPMASPAAEFRSPL